MDATTASGQKQTSRHHSDTMSALPPKADIEQTSRDVRFVPIATERNAAKATAIRSPYQHGPGAERDHSAPSPAMITPPRWARSFSRGGTGPKLLGAASAAASARAHL